MNWPSFWARKKQLFIHRLTRLFLASFLHSPNEEIFSFGKCPHLTSFHYYFSDEAINFSIQKGVQISRSTIHYYKHNDMEDLELVLRQVTSDDGKSKKKLTRRFIIFEALSYNYGDIAPLPKIVKPFIDELFVICF